MINSYKLMRQAQAWLNGQEGYDPRLCASEMVHIDGGTASVLVLEGGVGCWDMKAVGYVHITEGGACSYEEFDKTARMRWRHVANAHSFRESFKKLPVELQNPWYASPFGDMATFGEHRVDVKACAGVITSAWRLALAVMCEQFFEVLPAQRRPPPREPLTGYEVMGDEDFDPSKLDPGIRETVLFLRGNNFCTTDSGDGATKIAAGYNDDGDDTCKALDVPHVIMKTSPDIMIAEARRLRVLLSAFGVKLDAEGGKSVQAIYLPETGDAILELWGVML